MAKATASWVVDMHDPLEDINIVSATASEHKFPVPFNDSPHVTGGIWGVKHLCAICCSVFAGFMASVKVMSSL